MSATAGAGATWPGIDATLAGERVVLEPLAEGHREELFEAAGDPSIWTWLAPDLGAERALFDEVVDAALEAAAAGTEQPFATRSRADGALIGSTRYLALRPADRALEIGWTWLAPRAWGTGANVEAKHLMLRHAFERLGCVRVEFKTDARNERSRGALAALPAKLEGVHRKHRIVPGVGQRDSAFYSVVDEEWPAVAASLRRRLDA